MTVYYPQMGAILRVSWEDYGNKFNPLAQNVYTFAVKPRSASVDVNSYNQADTFEITLDYACFPFDPRMIRSVQISIHMEDQLSLVGVSSEPTEIEIKEPQIGTSSAVLSALGLSKDNAVFIGFVDEESISLDDSDRSITMKGRDFTALLIDSPWPGKLIDITAGSLDVILASILKQLPSAGDITLDNRTGLPTLPIISPSILDFGKLSGKQNAKKKQTYWDVIQQVIAQAALIGFIELDKLVLLKPKTLYSDTKRLGIFYGENVSSLNFHRKMGRQKGFNIRVESFSIEKRLKITADLPRESLTLPGAGEDVLIDKISTRGGTATKTQEPAPFMTFFVADVSLKTSLIAIGEKIYEEIGRQQLEGSFTTREMCIGKGSSLKEFEAQLMTDLRPGDAISIEVRTPDSEALNKLATSTEKVAYLVRRGWQPNVAAAYADAFNRFDTVFYTRSLRLSMDADSGFEVTVDFVNFIGESERKNLGI